MSTWPIALSHELAERAGAGHVAGGYWHPGRRDACPKGPCASARADNGRREVC